MINSVKTSAPVIKGCSKNVVVVKSPAPMFSEALFILKDEAFRDNTADRNALLNQAYEAARGYSNVRSGRIPWAAMAISSAAGACAALLISIFF